MSFMSKSIITKPVVGYEGYYEVDSNGNVWSLSYRGSRQRRTIKPAEQRGYKKVALCRDKFCKTRSVHRLVAEAFLPNPENKPQVNHKNGLRGDNRLSNLEWATQSENQKHSFRVLGNSRIGERNNARKLSETKVLNIFNNDKASTEELSRLYGVSKVTIWRIKKGLSWPHLVRKW